MLILTTDRSLMGDCLRSAFALRRWNPVRNGNLEETSSASAKKGGGTEHVEDEDERNVRWACRGREGEGWRDGREVEVAAGWGGESGGVWKRSGRWTGEQQSEAQERSLCSGCCLSAGSSGVLSVRRPDWTPLSILGSTLLFSFS